VTAPSGAKWLRCSRVICIPVNIVITGVAGQLGRALVDGATARGVGYRGLRRTDLDVTDPAAVAALQLTAEDVLINCAAYTAVDAAETDFAAAAALNASAPDLLAGRCRDTGARLVHVSTDYVFGEPPQPPRPWQPTDPTAPRTAYGATKLAGEILVCGTDPRSVVVRTSWLYTGPGNADFVSVMSRLAAEEATPNVVDDQVGSPTYAPDLAAGLLDLAALLAAEPDRPGTVVHGAGGGETSWYGLARAVFAGLGADPDRVRPCTSAEFVRPAPRPGYSVLAADSWTGLGLSALPGWRDGLARALAGAEPTSR
jgi:dTDP-4-dehydrorhamnose reductase